MHICSRALPRTCRSDLQARFTHRASSRSTGHSEATVSASAKGTATACLSPSCRAAARLEARALAVRAQGTQTPPVPTQWLLKDLTEPGLGPQGNCYSATAHLGGLTRTKDVRCTHLSLSSGVFLGSFVAFCQSKHRNTGG